MSIREFGDKLIRAHVELFQTGAYDSMAALEDTNVICHFPNGEIIGSLARKQSILAARQATTDLTQEWKYLTGEGHLLALSLKSRGISTGKGTIPPGKEVKEDAIFVFRLENDKTVEVWARGSKTVSDK